jgi:ferredoxin-NADP reductase
VAGTAVRRRLTWQLGKVVELVEETAGVKSLVLDLPDWPGHRAGQHVDVRLTAADGYQAQRSYSIASAPEDGHVVLTIERLEDGEVSPYLTDVVRVGDMLELRGPIGGYFVWEKSLGGPLFLVAGGSGIVPLRAMLRHWSAVGSPVSARLLYSSRSLADVIFRGDLDRLAAAHVDIALTLTREWPDDWTGRKGRVDGVMLREVAPASEDRALSYICGPTGFVEAVANALVELGHDPARIRTERFGPTGR